MKMFTPVHRIFAACAMAAVMFIHLFEAQATSDTWNQPGGLFQWTDPANWLSGTQYPNGSGDVASFTNDITSSQRVNITQAVTVGTINIGDSAAPINGFVIGSNITQTINLDNGASGLTINSLAGANTILARLIATGANSNLTVNVAGGTLDFGANALSHVLTVGSFTKTGAGTLTLWAPPSTITIANPYISIQGGQLTVSGGPSLKSNVVVSIFSGAGFVAGRAQTVAEIRGSGYFRGPGNAPFVVGDATGLGGTSNVWIAAGGRLRPGDTNALGQIGTLAIGRVSPDPAFLPQFQPGSESFFDIASYSLFDKIDAPRVFTTINGGDIYINFLGGFIPTNESTFRLFIDSSTQGYRDTNGGKPFDRIFDHWGGTNNWRAALGGDPFKTLAGGTDTEDPLGLGFAYIEFTYIPEPSATALLLAASVLLLRSRRS